MTHPQLNRARVSRERALAAVKAHPIATVVAIGTLTVALLATAGQQGHTPPAHNGSSPPRPARPKPAVGTPPASSRSESSPTRAAQHEGARGPASPRTHPRPLWPEAARRVAAQFLSTYLPFTYAQIPASKIRAVTPALRSRIAADPPDVPSVIRRLHPQITGLAIIPGRIVDAGPGWAATATITDGQESYQVMVKLDHLRGRWLVTALLTP
jgi:hypothetical protein